MVAYNRGGRRDRRVRHVGGGGSGPVSATSVRTNVANGGLIGAPHLHRRAVRKLGTKDGIVAMQTVFDRAAALLAFEQLGGADRCLDIAKRIVLDRYAFGRQIGGYQAIDHKLADIYVKNELARSNAYYGA